MYKKGRDAGNTSNVISNPPSRTSIGSNASMDQQSGTTSPEAPTHAQPVLRKHDSHASKDLMISYSHADKEIMIKIRDTLEANGISVWVDVTGLQAGVDFLSKIGDAIVDCKLFLSLLSSTSIVSKFCQDELALAYVSDRAIFPVALEDRASLMPAMNTGMKLQVARYEWTILGRDPNNFDERIETLMGKLKDELITLQQEKAAKDDVKGDAKGKDGKPPLERQDTRHKLNKKNLKAKESVKSIGVESLEAEQFWKDHFGIKEQVEWSTFVEVFQKVFKTQLGQLMSDEDQTWLFGILAREMEVEDNILFKFSLLGFSCVEGDYQSLWERASDQARESWAMKEVFDMDSSVRVEAIENLGKFRSAAVMDALRDLLSDEDANVRAVAAVSLARTNVKDPVTIKFLMKTLNDKDRLVREAGCLALGHLQVKQATSKLLHMWRNDVISHVRDAASVALSQIGGPEVEKAMRVTKVLADEIRQLTVSTM